MSCRSATSAPRSAGCSQARELMSVSVARCRVGRSSLSVIVPPQVGVIPSNVAALGVRALIRDGVVVQARFGTYSRVRDC
ncbi:hypothetical protein GCM10009789_70620 [Kribbella sancticallisti]|uniref:Uncharacterized protein n=1 Tax=Kribbella sancticallisti TaxID=460087 RepID=A0ABP4QGE3_9ACTN